MNKYTVNIRNLYENKNRTEEVNGKNVQSAHKTAFFKIIKQDEEIVSMEDSSGAEVFEVSKGFTEKV
jgi:hypothetical protein